MRWERQVDSCFMGFKIDAASKCIVVAKDYSSKSVMAGVVPVKGASNEFPAKRIKSWSPTHPSKDHLTSLTCGIVRFEWSGRKRSTDC